MNVDSQCINKFNHTNDHYWKLSKIIACTSNKVAHNESKIKLFVVDKTLVVIHLASFWNEYEI